MTECDACGDMVDLTPRFNYCIGQFEFTIPIKEETEGEFPGQTFEDRAYNLCFECQRRIVDWIDECQESETRIDKVELEPVARELESQAEELERRAKRLREFDSE